MRMDIPTKSSRFFELHASGTFVMPNPHDIGAARLLATLGFKAIATTSSGFAASLGQFDMTVSRPQLVEHARLLAAATEIPLNVDSEQCFPDDTGGVARTVEMLADVGAAGCSIEDWNPHTKTLDSVEVASERVSQASEAANRAGMVLTARAENHLRGVTNLDDTIARLRAYREAGAHCVFAPGLADLAKIRRVVNETEAPVNVLLVPGGPTVAQLSEAGVRRISLGGTLSRVAYGAVARVAQRLLESGEIATDEDFLDRELAAKAFGTAAAQ